MIINEYTKSELVKRSKTPDFNRYNRRMTVTPDEITIDRVVIGSLSSNSPHLDIYFKIRDYTTSLRLINCMSRARVLKAQSKYRNNNRKLLELAIDYSLKNNDLLINCSCPDFYYRFSYSATINHYGFNTNQLIPARIRNPQNKGAGCKHLMRVINAPSLWKNKVITAVLQVLREIPDLLGGE